MFIESEEEVDQILKEQGINIENDCITEKEIECKKNEIVVIEENSNDMKKIKNEIK